MMPETITQEAVIEKVRQRLGKLDAKAEQAVAHAIAVLNESRVSETSQQSEREFVSANVGVEQYEAWSPEERFQYLNNAKKINSAWVKKNFADLGAAWLMVIDGQVVAHGASIQHLPQQQEFDALCEKHGKYPFVFFNPRSFMIEDITATSDFAYQDFVLGLYVDEEISLGKAAKLLNMSYDEFIDFLGQRKIPYSHETEQEISDALQKLKAL